MTSQTDKARVLRHRAEDHLTWQPRVADATHGAGNERLLHELQVHQIELEMQNEELRDAEAALRESETKYRLLSDLASDCIFWVGPDGRFLYASPACHGVFGHGPEEFLARPGLLQELIHRDDLPTYLNHVADDENPTGRQELEFRIICPDGSERWIAHHCLPMYDERGSFIGRRSSNHDITERKRAEAEIRMLNQTLEARVTARTLELHAKQLQLLEALSLNENILTTSAMGIAAYRQDGCCVMVTPSFAKTVGGSEEQMLGQNFRQLASWRESGLLEWADGVLATGLGEEHEIHATTSFGRTLWLHCQLSRFFSQGEPHLLLMVHDITDGKLAEEELRLAASVFHNSAEGVLITDGGGTILSVNPAFSEITGYQEAEVLGCNPSLLRSDRHGPEFFHSMWNTLAENGCWRGEIWNRRKNGEAYLEWLTINRIDDHSGQPVRYVSVFHDITELRRKDEHIQHLAFHDALTGLPNRVLIHDRLQHALKRAEREGRRLSVTFIDLDRFKAVNDSLGHDVGDVLLQEVARRIKGRVRSMDTVARLGGDEFVVLMEDLGEVGDCACLAQALIAEIARPMELRGQAIEIGASLGIAFFPEDGSDPLELMKRADMAMYAAKSAGRNTYRFFQQDMLERTSLRLTMEMELKRAIANHELELHYQPKVALSTGKPLRVEALVRWRHAARGLMAPKAFIPLAEESGLIVDIGAWVLDEACRQAAAWQAEGRRIQIAINVSARELESCDLAGRVAAVTARHGIQPSDLEIELTESAVMANPESIVDMLGSLRQLGVTVALDDFGTGYSSLAYLRRLPIDVLKIDRSFIQEADRNEEDAQIVKTILALSQALKLTVVAEGIETPAQAELLQSLGCDMAQGYLFSHPLPASELEVWLDSADRNGPEPPTFPPSES